jgi:hypothetical protein
MNDSFPGMNDSFLGIRAPFQGMLSREERKFGMHPK